MTDEQIDKAADSLKKLMDEEIKNDPELRKKIEARRAERLARESREQSENAD